MCFSCAAQNTASSNAFFQASARQPYHLSIGAVLFNEEGKIACHRFPQSFGGKDVYILMRESMENDETPVETVQRGLMEEFGATARPIGFLGSLSGDLPGFAHPFVKTTLYIACELIEWDPKLRDTEDFEGTSIIEWHEPQHLISLMQQQGKRINRVDADESEIIKRALECKRSSGAHL
ncbi:MAG TPA: NUDIX hydrolase [Rhabdochlamydiaceae bacterium]